MSEFKRVRVRLWKPSRMKRHWYALHKALWLWLSKNPGSLKSAWPGWYWNGGAIRKVENDCFACYVSERCSGCKITWNGGHCSEHGFKLWELYTSETCTDRDSESLLPRIAALALKIMNAPLKEN